MSLRYKTAIVGAAETTQLGVIPDMSETQLHIDAAINAMRDADIDASQIDGVSATMNPAILAHYLGVTPDWVDNTSVGGTSFLLHMRHAAAAIASGLATTILCCMGQSGRSRVGVSAPRIGTAAGRSGPNYDASYPGQFESIYGPLGADYAVRHGRPALHEGNGDDDRAAGVGRRRSAQVVEQSAARHVSPARHGRGRPEQPDGVLSVPPVHVLSGDGRRRRVHPNRRRPRGRLPDQARLPARHGRIGGDAHRKPDARHDQLGGVQDVQLQGVPRGGRIARRHRPRPDIRRLRPPAHLRLGGLGLRPGAARRARSSRKAGRPPAASCR